MFISEIFVSIQGEGQHMGVPSLFIRTGKCNLRCTWCDTPQSSWKPEGSEYTVKELCAFVDQVPQISHVVITGGEPFLEKELAQLTRKLFLMGKETTIETSGNIPKNITCSLLSISPKLINSIPYKRAGGKHVEMHEKNRLDYKHAKFRTFSDL